MTGATEAFEGVVGLIFGGFLFLTFGSVAASTVSNPFIDFQLWGIIYLIAAVVLAAVMVYAAVISIFN